MTTRLILVSHAPTSALRTASFPADEPLDPPVASLPELSAEIEKLPKKENIYLYCTCRNELTSASVAHLLRKKGFNAFVIAGGLAAWRKAGNPLEPVPSDDIVHLPTFVR